MSFFKRLIEERLRLSMTQNQFAAIGEVSRGSQQKYESGETSPNTEYLFNLVKVDVDLHYLLFGERHQINQYGNTLTKEEDQFLHLYRTASGTIRNAALHVLSASNGRTNRAINVKGKNIVAGDSNKVSF